MNIPQNKTFKVTGIMSGTSLDGLDIAACSFRPGNTGKWSYSIDHATTIAYPENWKARLNSLFRAGAMDISQAHFDFGRLIGSYVRDFHAESGFDPILVASHGHTVFHHPAAGYTTQIGSGAAIAGLTGKPVVCDFRAADVCLGGQGAPLVPMGDELLFNQFDACLNLGGFANISFRRDQKRIAFDICPVNTVMNLLAANLGFGFDENGHLARRGKIIPELFEALNRLHFYDLPAPKSLGTEWLEANVLPVLRNADFALYDKLHTFAEHIATQIGRVLTENKILNVLITGGGAYNQFLIERLKALTDCELIIPGNKTIDYKEALIFALLGLLRWFEQPNCLASATGARRNSIAGAVYLPAK